MVLSFKGAQGTSPQTGVQRSRSMLILGDDLGFAFRLGDVLGAVGYEPVPARNVSEETWRTRTFGLPIDLTITNPLLAGVAEFTQTQRHDAGHLIDRFHGTVRQHGQLRTTCQTTLNVYELIRSRIFSVIEYPEVMHNAESPASSDGVVNARLKHLEERG